MAKTVRSIRTDDIVFDLMDRYNALRKDLGFSKVPYSDIFEEAVRRYLADEIVSMKAILAEKASAIDDFSAGL